MITSVPIGVLLQNLSQYLDPRDRSNLASTNNHFRAIFSKMVPAVYRKGNFNDSLYNACKGGHKELAQWLIDTKGATDFDWALSGACFGGHKELVQWLIDTKGATNFDWALRGACWGGHKELAQWLIDAKGATDFYRALHDARLGGHKELVQWLRETYICNKKRKL